MKTQLKALFILVDVLIIMVAYALSPAELSLAGTGVRKLNISLDSLMVPAPDSTQAATLAVTEVSAPEKVRDSSHQRILFFGDSMLEGLSRRLCDYVAANGHEQKTVLWYSSSSEKWATTKTLDYYIREVKPTFIICCLCSNELFVRDLDRREKFIATIVKKMGNTPFVWISPPNWKEDTGINERIIRQVGKERYFDSTHLTLARGRDKAHPTFDAAAHWFDLVAEWLESDQTAHPIVMKKPTEKTKWTNVTLMQPNDPGK